MWNYGGLFLFCWWLGLVYSKSVIDPELYNNEFWEQVPPGFLERLQQTLYGSNYDDYPEYKDEADTSGKLLEVPNWPTSKTNGLIGQVGGIALDSKGNLVVFHRADRRWDGWSFGPLNRLDPALGPIQRDVLMRISNKTGEIITQSGAGEYYMPHGLTIDKDDNLWLTDVGLHQVIKIPQDPNAPGLTLGEKLVPGSDDTHFCKPTDVAVASNGDFFVADGYCNGRIMKFSPDGNLTTQWGHVSTGMIPGNYDFHIPHSLALDESRDLLCVADRENGRIQCYSAGLNGTKAGAFRDRFEPGRGRIYAIEFDSTGERLFAVNGPGIGIIEGFTLDRSGNILETWGPDDQDFPSQPHDVTVSRDGRDVFVGDIGRPPKVWRFSRRGVPGVTIGK
ncbi:probable peptidyl-alpha-hydroxyglycine alpha-amidating lyase pgal-1 [Mercenaria mercenaria]|uniref:probable peptidyl-alpha-hydroxyglycine alpha-amidating lyase pgal-1 n=1 Tax=Mercenaria mercenaria TaxID=6596 RepID=UPI00234E6A3E|nr:probable peptidyl-alpha-hydroxyglycine alpha-amidating lyase pgal-1 [Mercenaria mercenaria]